MAKPVTITEYFDTLPEDRKTAIKQLRDTIRANLPSGFEESLQYSMPNWIVPHALSAGLSCGSQYTTALFEHRFTKNHIAVYHMGIYASPVLMDWFVQTYPQYSKSKLNMGKSCIRFKNVTKLRYPSS